MNIITGGIMAVVVFVVLITGKFAHELRANRKCAERGEPLVNVIDWTGDRD